MAGFDISGVQLSASATSWLVGWLVGWLVACLVDWLIT
jgi:hypothetical protein